MNNLTTAQAILGGFALISIPYLSNIVTPAHAKSSDAQRVVICDPEGVMCAKFKPVNGSLFNGELAVSSR